MSQQRGIRKAPATGATPAPKKHFWRPCALLINKRTCMLGGKGLGRDDPITCIVHVHKETDSTSWNGFTIEVPFGPNIEEEGFGICHGVNHSEGRGSIIPIKIYKIRVKFPRNTDSSVEEVPAELLKLFREDMKKMCILNVSLKPGDHCHVKQYGAPFSNPGHPSEKGIIQNEALAFADDMTLADILRQRQFSLLVVAPSNAMRTNWFQPLPPPFRYPYGEEHFWSEERYDDMLPKTRGPQFAPSWAFDNDNEHLAALTQSQVQDIMWIHKVAQEINEIKFRAYFINSGHDEPQDCKEFFVIVPLGEEFLAQFEQPWLRLTKSGFLKLRLFDDKGDEDKDPAKWDARIQEAPRGLDAMNLHPVYINDFVLRVRRPQSKQLARRPDFQVKVYSNRTTASIELHKAKENWTCVSLEFDDLLKDYIRKVDAVNLFHASAQPSNPIACGMPKEVAVAAKVARPPIPEDLKFKMALHRDLLRGNGFWDTLVPRLSSEADGVDEHVESLEETYLDEGDKPQTELPPPRGLPVVNLIDLPQEHYEALIKEALPADRQRFSKYLSTAPLGLACITAGPGFGKTTALAVGTLGMAATLRKIYATAPTHVATNNFAERLDRISQSVTSRRNEDRPPGENRARRTFVMRGFKWEEEYEAFKRTLENPHIGDKAAPNRDWSAESKWTLHLSPTFWLMMALRSPAVRELHEDDHPGIHAVQQRIEKARKCERLCAVATGAISWKEYQRGQMVRESTIYDMFRVLLASVDVLCTTPALSCQKPFRSWKDEVAKGIAVDEAGNISRPDLYSVWGNTLLPCLLSGDDKQLPPTVMTLNDKDADGNCLNRFGPDAKISALEFFRASGWPIYHLKTQLRMAKGLFDTCHREVYRDLPFTYGPGSHLAKHPVGQALEKYLTTRFPRLTPSPAGSIKEVFIHCPGTICLMDQVTKSKRNPDQVDNTLEFLSDLVKNSSVSPSSIAIITPYKANAELVERRRKDPAHSLLFNMPPASTIDSFQGREADIIVVIMGTTQAVGPGFTTIEHRLNVMLSRQRSGLLIFGDINVLGNVEDSGNGKAAVRVTAQGDKQFVQKGMLFNVLRTLHWQGRVITLRVRAKK
ncbi:hypothetical protein ACHAQJ_006985 [Trichoderma viride]